MNSTSFLLIFISLINLQCLTNSKDSNKKANTKAKEFVYFKKQIGHDFGVYSMDNIFDLVDLKTWGKSYDKIDSLELPENNIIIFYSKNGFKSPYYVEKGDTLYTIKQNNQILLRSKQNNTKAFTYFENLVLSKNLEIGNEGKYILLPEKLMLDSLYNQYSNRNQNLDALNINNKDFNDKALAFIKHRYYLGLLIPFLKPNLEHNKHKLTSNLIDSLKNEIIESANYPISTSITVLYDYLIYYNKANNKNITNSELMKTASKLFPNREDINFYLLKREYEKSKKIDSTYFKLLTQKKYLTYFENEEIVNNNNYKGNTLLDVLNKPFNLDSLIKNNNNNYLILDMWASWCVPCINEFDHYEKIKSVLKSKKIKVVFISLDNKYNSWLSFMKSKWTLNHESYILKNEFDSDFAKKYKIISIPRVLIFDKNGNEINNDALSPSNQKFLSQFK